MKVNNHRVYYSVNVPPGGNLFREVCRIPMPGWVISKLEVNLTNLVNGYFCFYRCTADLRWLGVTASNDGANVGVLGL